MKRRNLIILIAVLLTLGVVGVYVLLLYLSSIIQPPPLTIHPSLECNVLGSGVLDYGSSSEVVYLFTQVNGKDIKSVDINVKLYDAELPRDIYVLDYSSPGFSGCTECESLPDFRNSLEATLKKYGLLDVNSTLNQIKINQFDKLTHRSILIVPTGKIPAQLIGLESGPDLGELMNRGFVVIFLGRDLEQAFYRNGSIVKIPRERLSSYGISYNVRRDLSTCGGYRLQNPAFTISQNISACSMSFVSRGDGYFFVLPRSIDIGWNANGTIAGEDVGRVIYNLEWRYPLTTSLKMPVQKINASTFNSSMIFLKPSQYASGWARIFLVANTTNNSPFYLTVDKKITNPIRGVMLHTPQAVGDDRILVDFRFSESLPKPKDVNISIAVYKDMQFVEKQYAHSIKIQTEYMFSSNFLVDISVGNYTLRAEDDDGYVYAQSFLNVPPINVSYDFHWYNEPQFFIFHVRIPRDPIPEKEGVELDPLSSRIAYITINNTPDKNLFPPYSNASDIAGKLIYIPSQPLTFGWYTLKVNISRQVIAINDFYRKPPSWLDNPINIVILVSIVIVGVIAIALRRPEKPVYTIDIPDFPPLEKVAVPISKFSVLSLFDSVNKEYKWSFMPLTAPELKNEMRRKITYKGVPILITDYNLDKILEELIETGDVVKALNLYGLKTWETKSGRNMRYLALFRLLRNFFINNAIPFTDLNQRKDCDMLATVKGEGIYMHIYIDESTLRRALELSGAGKNFIVFESKKELEEVVKKLDLSYNPMAVILKSEVGIGGLQLLHPGNFGEMLGR